MAHYNVGMPIFPITFVCGQGGTYQILQYGHMMKTVFTVMKRDGHAYYGETGPISVDELALVQVILESNTNTPDIAVYVRIKRKENTKSAVPLSVRCEEFHKELFCSDDWIETEIKRKEPDNRLTKKCDCGTMRLFKIEITFTEHAVYSTSLVSDRLYEDTEFTDFQLQAIDGNVAVHKNVLCMHSDRFKEMLNEEWKGKTEGHIDIDGVTVQTLQHLKDYMYLETLPDFTEYLELLLIIATRYMLDKLKADCIRKLIKLVIPGKMDNLIILACQNNIPELVTALVFDVPDNQKYLDRFAKSLRESCCQDC